MPLSDRERADLLLDQERNDQAIREASQVVTRLTKALADAYALPASLIVVEGRLRQRRTAEPLPSESAVRDAVEELRGLEKKRDEIRRALTDGPI